MLALMSFSLCRFSLIALIISMPRRRRLSPMIFFFFAMPADMPRHVFAADAIADADVPRRLLMPLPRFCLMLFSLRRFRYALRAFIVAFACEVWMPSRLLACYFICYYAFRAAAFATYTIARCFSLAAAITLASCRCHYFSFIAAADALFDAYYAMMLMLTPLMLIILRC